MKWITSVAILMVGILSGLVSWLIQPGSAQAPARQAGSTGDFQNSIAATASATPSPAVTPTPGENSKDFILYWPVYIPLIRLDPMPTPTNTPTVTPTPSSTPGPAREFLVCSAPGSAIPDGSTTGLRSDITLQEQGVLLDLEVYVRISHSYVGDLSAELVQRNVTPVRSVVLFNRPGLANDALAPQSTTNLGCSLDNIQAIFDDRAEQSAENKCQSNNLVGVAIGGMFKPQTSLDQFRGQPAAGVWSLLVGDNAAGSTGTLDKWCLHGWVDDTASPLPTPAPVTLPSSKIISGVTGQHQALPLDCETRSAVDWAKFFGVTIDELSFFNQLPGSDNPDEGFVGNVNGTWGQIPPNDYGIHAWPVANLLRTYGLTANANRGLKFDDLRAEIAKGHPAIVWIVGNVERSAPEYYMAKSDPGISIVARYEHTVIVYGYDSSYVYVQNGGMKDAIDINRFLDSWSALGNMAIFAQP